MRWKIRRGGNKTSLVRLLEIDNTSIVTREQKRRLPRSNRIKSLINVIVLRYIIPRFACAALYHLMPSVCFVRLK